MHLVALKPLPRLLVVSPIVSHCVTLYSHLNFEILDRLCIDTNVC